MKPQQAWNDEHPEAPAGSAGWGILRVRLGKPDRNTLRVRLEGELDAYAAGDLAAALREVEAGCTRLVIDLSRLTFLDCAGLHQIVEAERRVRARGGRLTLVAGPAPVQRVFNLTRLDRAFQFESVDYQAS